MPRNEKLVQLIKDHGMTQRKLGEYMGVTEGYISKIVNNRMPDLRIRRRIAAFFGVDGHQLFPEVDE